MIKEITIGTMSQTRVAVVYIQDVTNPKHVETVQQRLENIDFDILFDSSQLDQIMSDNSHTPFPLFLSTERIDRVINGLTLGQVAIISSASPYVLTGPTTIFDFFISPEDYYLPWVLGSLFRLIRIFGVCFSVLMTPAYTAVLTYHLEMIPKDMLGPIIISRNYVPFPPVLEVLFLELTIELLREAGARLPTKVGQTLGIVGGIVIGQASVAAALTSNILLIIVALSARVSFTTPIYKMSNTIRFLRFPLIILSGIWGGFGIVVGLCFILTHLIRLKSLGTPYLAPLYPFRRKGYADSFIRASYSKTARRSPSYKPFQNGDIMLAKQMSKRISMTNFIHHRVSSLFLSAKWITLGLLCVVLTACSSSRIINDVQLIHALGYDQVDNQIKGTAITHRYEKDQANVEMLETSAISLYSIFPEINTTTPSQLELGQLRSVVIGKDFAAKGIGTLVHSLCRDPNIGFRLQLAVADPHAESILEVNRKVNIPFYLSDMIEQNT